jgi:hypothetical protein
MAARNITLQFAEIVSIALKKEGAIDKDSGFLNLCVGGHGDLPEHAPTPRKAPYTCPTCGPLPPGDQGIVKGKAVDGGYAILTPEEIADAKSDYGDGYKGAINLVAHPAAEFLAATAPGDSVSYLTPASDAVINQYATIVAFIESHPELVFVGLNNPQSVTALFQVTARNGVLVMEKRVRSERLKPVPKFDGQPMAKLLAFLDMVLEDEAVLKPYKALDYADQYAATIAELASEASRLVEIEENVPSTFVRGTSDADLLDKLNALREPTPKAKAKKKTKKEVAA